jgi:hypothetical protein
MLKSLVGDTSEPRQKFALLVFVKPDFSINLLRLLRGYFSPCVYLS